MIIIVFIRPTKTILAEGILPPKVLLSIFSQPLKLKISKVLNDLGKKDVTIKQFNYPSTFSRLSIDHLNTLY